MESSSAAIKTNWTTESFRIVVIGAIYLASQSVHAGPMVIAADLMRGLTPL
jgi:hypothetical protein